MCSNWPCSAIINRCGFNSEGIQAVAKRLGAQHGKRKLDESASTNSTGIDEGKRGGKAGPGILGVNLGKNKSSEDAAKDYVQGVHTLSQYADYLVDCLLILLYCPLMVVDLCAKVAYYYGSLLLLLLVWTDLWSFKI